jgi:hypothetical protein
VVDLLPCKSEEYCPKEREMQEMCEVAVAVTWHAFTVNYFFTK